MKDIKTILQREIDFHNKERKTHLEMAEKIKSKKQKQKALKHFHKRFQTVKIAKEIGFEFCPKCERLR